MRKLMQMEVVWYSTWAGPCQIRILEVRDTEFALSYLAEFVGGTADTNKPFIVGHSEWSLSFERPVVS